MPGKDKKEIERVKVLPGQVWRSKFPNSRLLAVEVSVVAIVLKYANREMRDHVRVVALTSTGRSRVTHIRLDRLRVDYELQP
jgi:hypothetical protein